MDQRLSFKRTRRFLAALPTRISGQWAGPLTVAAVLMLCGIFGETLWSSHEEVRREAEGATRNLTTVVAQDIARNIEIYNLSLQAVVDGFGNPLVMDAAPDLRQLILFDRSATAKYLGAIIVLNSVGDLVIESQNVKARAVRLSDRDYFEAHKADPKLGLYISAPFVSRLDGTWNIALSRRLNHPDGSFAGVVAGTLRIEYVKDLFARMNLGAGGSMSLFRTDGTLIMRQPLDRDLLGEKFGGSGVFQQILGQREGIFESRSEVDGVPRLFVYRRIGDMPLLFIAGVAIDELYAGWWRKSLATGLIVLSLSALILVLTSALKRELRRRAAAEASLARLAATDKLTGLANRRSFDDSLEREWRRALREGKPVSLLMLDVDHFKAFNDASGHLAGDDVLSTLGGVIAGSVRRPADVAARYGGEEFAVLLPNTEAEGAFSLAESIRMRVLELDEPHPACPSGRLSISLGVATIRPGEDQRAHDLVAAADAALYRSKRHGRNRTTAAKRLSGAIAA